MAEEKKRKLKVLCLHGSGTNKEFINFLQMSMSCLRTLCEWHYMDGIVEADPFPSIKPFLKLIKQDTFFSWLKKSEDGTKYTGFDEACEAAITEAKRLDADLLLGFSQGSSNIEK